MPGDPALTTLIGVPVATSTPAARTVRPSMMAKFLPAAVAA